MLRFKFLALLLLLLFPLAVFAQSLSTNDLSKIKVDDLTNEQIQEFQKKAQSSGMTDQQMETMARSRGMSASEYQKLKSRMSSLSTSNKKTNTDLNKDNKAKDDVFDFKQIKTDAFKNKLKTDTIDTLQRKIFGYYLFNANNLTFEPSANMPTPKNYLLSAGDQLSISIWGASQADYSLTVTPEGQVNIPLVGPVFVSGLTIEHASDLIKMRLRKIYAGLGSNTYALINLSKIRSIKVNIVGEARVPGSYNLSSLSSVFNALYVCGGPNYTGSFRSIKVMRENKQVADIDVYNYLLKGDQSGNVKLHDQDVILISEYQNRVEISGEVKRPFIYEMKDKETLDNLLNYAGGFKEKAYTQRIKVYRNSTRERQIFDVGKDSLKSFAMINGDSVVVEPILNRYENLVEITGAVYRAGKFSLEKDLTLKSLIKKAEGLRGDAYLPRAIVYRTKENFKMEAIQVNLEALMNGSVEDIPLVKDDRIKIFSLFDLQEEYKVTIDGAVGKPGDYPYVESMSLSDLIAQAGGFLESASNSRIEIARRITGSTKNAEDSLAVIITINVDKDLKFQGSKGVFILQPFDQVYIRTSPNYREQKNVVITGEVNYPGEYAINSRIEKLSDLINRSGGFTSYAYPKGAKLMRKYNPDNKLEVIKKYGEKRDSLIKLNTEEYQAIGLNIEKIVKEPGSPKYDIILEPGDSVVIPKELQTIGINGAVLYPIQARYNTNFSFSDYISQAGGFADNAQKRKSFVIYANGSVAKTNSFLWFKSYPNLEPGAEIVVPRKPEKKGSVQETIAISSSLASMALIIITIVNLIK
jgi:protein involved in polysaccharide export with SLBB domain